ncbi:FAD-dependent oxidoreductase [Rhodobacteraceae bacterium N5(2021)]|uniref:FAD-dependent oxidoreductase n=1 Tax=Gymnodinialimonas phycosphaerae TaxID=2841589 RepID=A0A975TSQ2_9RHOB|nr:FAD-dependent oxidoreductase [Gymnodinialimonas phycosphaerae]MBY4893931.1 FAD-dependent oxidoreductase [Gymnodinialimonas phycosphaerae]
MPFETPVQGSKKIAVIGAGISGMAAAYHLATDHHVTLIEAEGRLGGHARTVVAGKNGDQPVDTGFIVFNHVNYPNLVRLFEELDVPTTLSDMSFAASIDGGRIEYGLRSLRALLAQPANLLRPGFVRMVRDLMRFNAEASSVATDSTITLGQLMDQMNMGPWFREYYLAPVSGAIWSTPKEEIMDFPAQALVRFFRNHHLLAATGQHQWYTVQGGSIEYVTRLEAAMRSRGVDIRLGRGVEAVKRDATGVHVQQQGHWEAFDEVVFATHSDDTLAMLADPSTTEIAALGAVRYQSNQMVLHADARSMPKRRATWSSWNYTERPGFTGGPIDLTYWMNCLQPIPESDPMFVTLNSRAPIDDKLIYDTATFRHPVYDLPALAAQKTIAQMNGENATWFCGAWMKNGFHEDGYASAMDVVESLKSRHASALVA